MVSSVQDDKIHEFRFRVTIDKTGANGAVIADSNRTVSYGNGITFRNNVAEFTLHNGETKIITGLPTGLNYTVEELKEAVTDNNAFTTDHFTTVVTDGTVVAKDKLGTDAVAASTGTISATESSAAFQNTRNTKKLTINKTLTNAIPADDGDIFYFDVMLAGEDDKALRPDNATQIKVAGTAVATEKGTGEHPLYYDAEARIIHNVPVTWNAATETASAGGSVEITGLPVGTTYSISERGWTVETTSDYIEQVSDNVENQTLLNDASVVFTNNRKTSALTVTKKITSNVNEDTNHYFWFKVELPGSGIADGTYDETGVTNTPKNGILTFSNNVAYVKLKANETAAAYNLPSDLDYTVTEIRTEAEFDAIPEEIRGSETFDADYYAMFDPTWETSVTTAADTATGDDTEQGSDSETAGRNTSGNGAVTEGKTQDAATMVAFTNTRKTGDLNLNKVIYSGIQSEKDAYYFFKVELKTAEGAAAGSKVAVNGTYDVTIDGTTKKVTFKNGQAVIPVKGDSTVVLKGLPVNVEYMVTEVEAQTADIDGTYTNGYTAAKFNKSGEVTADDPGTVATSGNAVTISNIHKVSVPVRKDWNDADNQDGIRPASITVELYAKSGSETEPVSTKKTVTLNGNGNSWTGSFDDLNLYGNYDAEGNYTGSNDLIEYSVREKGTPTGYTITPANGTTVTVDPESSADSTNPAGDTNAAGSNSSADTIADVAVITNTHTPELVSFAFTKNWDRKGYPERPSDEDLIANLTLTANYNDGTADEPKNVTVDVAEQINANWKEHIRFCAADADLTDSDALKANSGSFGDSYKVAVIDLPKYMPGKVRKELTYTITETPLNLYSQITDGQGTAKASALNGESPTNIHDTGSLEITKAVVSDLSSDETRVFTFTVSADRAVSGTYSLTYKGGDKDRQRPQTIAFTANNGKATASGLTLIKGESVTINGLPTDVTYTVTETQVTNFEAPAYSANAQKLTTEGQKIATTVTNTRKTGNIILKKVVSSPVPAEESASYNMTLTLTPKESGAQIVAPEGGFTVKTCAPKAEGSGFDETTSKKALTNGKNTITVPAGGYVIIAGLPVDVDYNITEPGYEQFEKAYASLAAADDEGTTVNGSAVSGSIGADATTGAEVTNTRKKGELNISKTVVSSVQDDKTHEFRFRVTIDKTGANGAVIADSSRTVNYGDGITFRNNVAEITLHSGETKTITGLPTGLNYTVEELKEAASDDSAFTTDHFTTVVTGGTVVAEDKLGTDAVAASTGTISATAGSAAFQNTRNTTKLTINKTLTNAIPADDGDIFYFDVTLAGEDGKALQPDNATQIKVAGTAVATEKGTGDHPLYYDAATGVIHNVPVTWHAATGTASAGGSVEITGLPVGTTYSISETGWTISTTSAYIEKVSADVADKKLSTEAAESFTNNRKTSTLTVTKKITSNVNADTDRYFWFKVELPGSGMADGTYDENDVSATPKNGILTFSNNVAYVKLKANETAAAYNLPSDLAYTVTEIRTETEFEKIPAAIRGNETFDTDYYAMFDPTWETSVSGNTEDGTGAKAEGKTQDTATAVAFTNTRKTGDLNLNKVIHSGIQSEKNAYYFFKVELKTAEGAAAGNKVAVNGTYDVVLDGATKKVTFKNGQAVIPVKGDSTVVLKGLPVNVEYTVTEVEDETADVKNQTADSEETYTNGYTAAKFNKSGEVTADAPGTVATSGNAATITNIHKVSIPVRKDWADEDNQDGIRPASITVELYAKSGSQKEPVSTKKTITLNGNGNSWTGSFDDLNLYGRYDAEGNYSGGDDRIEYSVRETSTPTGYTVTPANGTTAEIDPAETTADAAVITNTHTLELVSFAFTKNWDRKGYPERPSDEDLIANLTLTASYNDGTADEPKNVTVDVAEQIDENWKDHIRFCAADADLTNSDALKADSGSFGDSYKVAVIDLPKYMPGKVRKELTYSITETPLELYSQITDGQGTAKASALNGESLTNIHDTGSLEITKAVVSDLSSDDSRVFTFTVSADKAVSGTYSLTYKGGNANRQRPETITFRAGDGKATASGLTLIKGESVTINGLPTDVTYTVAETQVTNFEAPEYSANAQKLTTEGQKIATTVTNTRKTGNIVLKKVVDSPVPVEKSASYNMTLTLTPKESGAQIVAPEGGFTVKTYAPKAQGDGFDETASKMALTNGANTITVPAGGYVVIAGLPVDVDYSITEPGNGQFEKTYASLATADDEGTAVDGSSVSGSVTDGGTTGAEVTNTRKKGELNISKTVVSSVQDDKTHEFRFRVTIDKTGANGAVIADSSRTVSYGNGITFRNNVAEFTLHSGETKIITGLPTGLNYTVEELKEAASEDSVFTTDHFTTVVTGGTIVAADELATDAVAASTGTISATESSAAFRNTRNTKKLTINKTLTNAIPADDGDIFYFDVTLAGEDRKALRPDDATQIKVADTAVPAAKGTGEHPLYYDAATGVIHNVPVTWNAATGTASAGGSVEITGLPVGTTYSISETGWTVETTSDYIEQVSDNVENQTLLNDASEAFTNNRKTNALTVTKKVTSNVDADTDRYFWFKVELPGSGIADGTYDENGVIATPKDGILTFSGNVAYVKLKANETAVAYNLPSDLAYTVTEIRTEAEFEQIPAAIRGSETFDAEYNAMFDPAWETSVGSNTTDGTGAKTEGETQSAATAVTFTNTRKTGDLNLKKVLYSDVQGEKNAYYFFKVELKTAEGAASGSKVAVNGTYNVSIDGATKKVTFKNGQAVIPVKGDSTVVLKGLPINVEYTVAEVEERTADIDGAYTNGYTAAKFNKSGEVTADAPGTVAASGNTVTITNIHKVSIPVQKAWDDGDDQDGIRPASITVELYAKSGSQKEPVSTKKTLTLEGDTWTGSFDDLNLYGSYDANGNYSGGNDRIEYSVRETATPAGYTVTPANGTIAEINPANTTAETAVITNSHVTETVEVKGEKIWKDANNQDGIRPRSITVNLMNGSTRVESKTVEAGRDGKWTFSFTGLPKNENGSEIPYTVTENPVRGYDAPVITGSISEGFRITNPHVTATVHISGTKTWNDEDNEDGSRPTSIVVKLLADGRETARRTVQEDAYGNWTYDFGDLPMNRNGKKITYVIAEDPVEGYETAVNGYNLTNTHEPEESPTPTSESGSGSDRTRRRNQGLDVDGDTDITENNDLYYTDSEGVRRRRSDGAPVDKDGNVIGPPLYGSSVTGSSPAVSRGTSPKTGDTNAPLPFILMMLGAMLSIGGVFRRKRRN
ncbi:MAG: Cna B-type domain-containing protein [Lachnospiraceae bacterium]|nr:Cna B-type domain-containing protein [Lachnospiraceae bacterium]